MKTEKERNTLENDKGLQIPSRLLEAVQGGISVTDIDGDALKDLEQRKCPACKKSLSLANERSLFAGSNTTLRYFVCYDCVRIFEQKEYGCSLSGSSWGEVTN